MKTSQFMSQIIQLYKNLHNTTRKAGKSQVEVTVQGHRQHAQRSEDSVWATMLSRHIKCSHCNSMLSVPNVLFIWSRD